MVLSTRAQKYLLALSDKCRWSTVTRDELSQRFAHFEIPTRAEFLEFFLTLQGITLVTPFEYCRVLKVDELDASYLRKDECGLWLSCCETNYPGDICLHESGSLHFETSSANVWFDHWSWLVEQFAYINKVVGESCAYRCQAIASARSVEELRQVLELVRNTEFETSRSAFFRFDNCGLVEFMQMADIQTKGVGSLRLMAHTEAAVGSFKSRLGDKLQYVNEVK